MKAFFRLSTTAVAASAMMAAGSAYAADNDTMTVSAEVTAVCDVVASPFTFTPKATNTGTDWDHTASPLSITCTNGAGYSIKIDPGANQETLNTSDRRMLNGTTDFLPYKLYSDAFTTEVLPNNTNGNYSAAETGSGEAQTHDLWARVAAADLTAAKALTYTDTVTVTVTLN